MEGGGEGGGEGGAGCRKRGEVVRSGQNEAELRAGDGGARGDDDEGEAGVGGGALEAMPRGGRGAAPIGFGSAAEIEDDEGEVGVAGEKIGGAERFGESATAHPHEVGEGVGGERGRIEGVVAVDQGDAEGGGAGDGEELAEEELAAATRGLADDLGDGAQRESTGGSIEGGDTGGQNAAGRFREGWEALGEEMAERGQRSRRGRHDGNRCGGRRVMQRAAGGGGRPSRLE